MPIRAAFRFAVAWGLIIFFVALLTFIFSFLGTLLCAALAGMMLGAARLAVWQTSAISLVFPGVIFGVLRASKSEMLGWQIVMLAALCCAAFWFTYFLGSACLRYERNHGKTALSAPRRRGQLGEASAASVPAACAVPAPAGAPAASPFSFPANLTLAVLQGRWSSARTGAAGSAQERTMEIEQESLVLKVADASGQVRLVARADIRLAQSNGQATLLLSRAEAETSADTLITI